AMPNTAGAARFENELKHACGTVASIQKHKCRAFCATEDGTWREEVFAAWRRLGEPRKVPGTELVAQAGLFSPDHPDPGSVLLAEHLPAGLRGRVADLGAGWGFLAAAILRRCPKVERVDLYEADARALDCARLNLRAHGARTGFFWHDVRRGVPEGYDAVVMNPPFHEGRDTRLEVGLDFIATTARALKRGGGLYLVANRQLPYEGALTQSGLSCRAAGGDATYKLLFAVKSTALP
nr:class I SAM-dependent methyltransferase [Akkermansiaceae bacterium]